MILVNPAKSIKVNPTLGATQKLYAGGSDAVLKYLPEYGPTPTQITDLSGHGNHGAFTDAPTPTLVNGRWCYQFVSASTNYCTIPDITELLGATAATWLAWVRKDAYAVGQCVASDYVGAGASRWALGFEGEENSWRGIVGDNTNTSLSIHGAIAGVFTVGWHFVWMRFVGSTSKQIGCDNSIGISTDTIPAALGAGVKNATYIGRITTIYSSITLGALTIFPRAITDAERDQWRYAMKARLGL
jgi:hypothetical protein